ncbi:unnamed protein product [Microthlaspi erraticum]|uniref:RING-type E3 ubiquitin transferase n=1 Tax=Microthlaspi erraticum TaxID=1685480 RepID=A0A6D2KX04_9BRAS|nr:unnamed protein product [Microthlaspi erraticum]
MQMRKARGISTSSQTPDLTQFFKKNGGVLCSQLYMFSISLAALLYEKHSKTLGNGPFRTFGLYWCYHCHRTVRIASSNPSEIAWPRCLRQFVVEIEMRRPLAAFPPFDASPETPLLEALSLMFDSPALTMIKMAVYLHQEEHT